MRRDAVLSILRRHRDELARDWGVSSPALLGSTACDEAADGAVIEELQDIIYSEAVDVVGKEVGVPPAAHP